MKKRYLYPSDVLTIEDAFYYHDTDLLRDLLRKGLSPNSRMANGEWLFIEAFKRFDSFSLILHGHGAETNVCSLEGGSALCIACEKGHERVVYDLLRYGANPNVKPSPMEAAQQLPSPARERIMRLRHGF